MNTELKFVRTWETKQLEQDSEFPSVACIEHESKVYMSFNDIVNHSGKCWDVMVSEGKSVFEEGACIVWDGPCAKVFVEKSVFLYAFYKTQSAFGEKYEQEPKKCKRLLCIKFNSSNSKYVTCYGQCKPRFYFRFVEEGGEKWHSISDIKTLLGARGIREPEGNIYRACEKANIVGIKLFGRQALKCVKSKDFAVKFPEYSELILKHAKD